ncbi:LOW QUALITY PROTEIN: uncharacterized protein Osi16 [Anoplolepis gracilipes]|uniref:LOW QUALITY PROTEIN: uncharacterized protein Osi16 n=1 Tax=Anoplolepis gracilipes TaxID=354296 RepID=UPI003BA2EC35
MYETTERQKGKRTICDSLYIYCKYPRVCPVHDTRLIRQLPSSSRISRCWRSVDLERKKFTNSSYSNQVSREHQKIAMKGITHDAQLSRCHLLLLLVLFLSGCVSAEIDRRTSRQTVEEAPENLASNLNKDCGKSYSATCLKLDVVSFLDKLSEQENIGILPGVSVIKENSSDVPASEVVANLARDFPNDVEKRLDAYLVHKVRSYLNSHSISIKLFDPRTFEAARSFNENALSQLGLGGNQNVETGRKKDKGHGGLMAGLLMMKGTLGAMGFGALALLAGKALMTGLLALMLSAIIGLKSLSHHEKKTTYEIVSKPVYSSSHTHSSEEHHGHGFGHSGYGRSLDSVHDSLQQAVLKYGNARDRRSIL